MYQLEVSLEESVHGSDITPVALRLGAQDRWLGGSAALGKLLASTNHRADRLYSPCFGDGLP